MPIIHPARGRSKPRELPALDAIRGETYKLTGRMATRGVAAVVILVAATAAADDAPLVEHQPSPCTVPGKRISLCATVTDDHQVAAVRTYFKARGEKLYSFVDMAFGGLAYCATLPGPREKAGALEYYVEAVDDQYQSQRTSTHVLPVQPEGQCEFPPVAKGHDATAILVVHATHRKQGRRLSGAFDETSVTFVPAPGTAR